MGKSKKAVERHVKPLVGGCNSPFHPEWHGKPCQCITCQPVGYCVEDPCEDCNGPVDGCQPPDDDDNMPLTNIPRCDNVPAT